MREVINNYGICAIIMDDDITNRIFNNFFLIKYKWHYMPTDEDIRCAIDFIQKHYDKDLTDFFVKTINDKRVEFYISKNIDSINRIAWWIPIKKIRDKYRESRIKKIKDNVKPFYN